MTTPELPAVEAAAAQCPLDGPEIEICDPEAFAAATLDELRSEAERYEAAAARHRQRLNEGYSLVLDDHTGRVHMRLDVIEDADVLAWFLRGEIERRGGAR